MASSGFHAIPHDIATALSYTGIDPFRKEVIYVARGLKDRKMQRALMQFSKPENWLTVWKALIQAGRQNLIGFGCDCLIPAQPLKEAIEARRRQANDPDHYHSVANPAKRGKTGERGLPSPGYRPGRNTHGVRTGNASGAAAAQTGGRSRSLTPGSISALC